MADFWEQDTPAGSLAVEEAPDWTKQDSLANPLAETVRRFKNLPEGDPTKAGIDAWNKTMYVVDRWPGIGPMLGAERNIIIKGAADRIQQGNATPADYGMVANHIIQQEKEGQKGFGAKVFDTLSYLPGFGIEMALTGGTYGVAKEGLTNLGERALGQAAERATGQLALGAAARAGGVAAQTANLANRVALNASQRAMPNMGVAYDAAGNVADAQISDDDKSFLASLPAGFLDTAIEVGSERAGERLTQGAGYLAGKIPGANKIAALKDFIASKWMAKATGRTPEMFNRALQAAGWHGIVGELLEERAGDVARLATGLESPDQNVVGQLGGAAYSGATGDTERAKRLAKEAGQQLAVEAVSFSVPGMAQAGVNRFMSTPPDMTAQEANAAFRVNPDLNPRHGASVFWQQERVAKPAVDQMLADGKTPEQIRDFAANPSRAKWMELGLSETSMPNGNTRRTFGQNAIKYLDSLSSQEQPNAQGVRENAGQVQEPGNAGQSGQEEGGQNLQQPPPQEPGNTPEQISTPGYDLTPKTPPPGQQYQTNVASPAVETPPVTPETPPSFGQQAVLEQAQQLYDFAGRAGKLDAIKAALQAGKPTRDIVAELGIRHPDPDMRASLGERTAGEQVVHAVKMILNQQQKSAPPIQAPTPPEAIPEKPQRQKKAKKTPPPPELAAAGITVTKTPKGWAVLGLPEEMANGLREEYQGKRAGKGHFFRRDPTQGIVDAAKEIAEEARQAAAAKASGLVRTRIGTLTPEAAQYYEQERAARLSLAKEQVAERNAGVEELIGQFVHKASRGAFKLRLLNAAERGDATSIPHFDEMVEYAKDHPELGLPSDETKLLSKLAGEAFRQDDAALLDQIDNELAAQIAAELGDELGDTSFDFGANVEEQAPTSKQGAIPGLENLAADMNRKEQVARDVQASKQQFEGGPKRSQKAFLSGLDENPAQKTAFDVDGFDQEPPAKTKLQESADAATKDAFDELDAFGRMIKGKGLFANPMFDPEVIAGAGRVVAKFAKAGTLKFAALIEQMVAKIGQAAVDRIRPALESEWEKLRQSGQVPGMEPITQQAQPQEAPSGDSNLTSIKNEVATELRQQRGLAEVPGAPAQTRQKWLDAAAQRIADSNGTIGRSLVDEINKSPRNLDNVEVAVLQVYYRGVNNAFESASNQLFKAVESKNPVAIAVAQTHADNLLTELDSIERASKAAGREWGKSGVARQIVLAQDFSLASMMRKARVANGGQALNAEQTAKISELANRVATLEKQLAESDAKRMDLEREKKVADGIAKDAEEAKQRRATKKSERRQKAEANVASAWAEFKAMAGESKLFANPAVLAVPALKIVKAYVDLGVVSFGEFMANAIKTLGKENAEKVRATFQQAWNDLKAKGDIPAMDLEQTDTAGISRFARDIQRQLVEAGITNRDQVVDAVHESLKEFWPDITRRETMDALSGYGQFSPLSKDEISTIIRDINGQLQQLAKLDDMQQGQAPAKTGRERRTPSDEERQLIQQVNEAKKRGGFNVTDPQQQLKTALDAAKTATRNRIADLQHEIDTKERIVANRTPLKPDAELEALRKQRDELKEVHKQLFPPQGATQEQKILAASRALDKAIEQLEAQIRSGDVAAKARPAPLSTPELDAKRARLDALREQRDALRDPTLGYKADLKKRIADYQQRIANGEFAPKPKKEARPLTREELDLKRQLEDAKHEFFEAAGNYHLANMSPLQKVGDYTREVFHLMRAVMTSFDLSAVFRQGGIGTFSHPGFALRAGLKMLNAFASRQAEFDSMEEIRNRPNGQLYQTARLAITEEEGRLTRQEEAFMGRWGKKIPGIAGSSRAYTTYLNNLRADMFDALVANLGKSGAVTLDEAKVIAYFVNAATGRADLGQYNSAMATLNTVFFAPRFVASRFQYLFMPFHLPFMKTTPRVKLAIAAEYGRYAAGVGLFMALAVALGRLLPGDDEDKPTIEFDPRSSDFGKIKIGETRIDPLSGLAQVVVFLSRLASGQTKNMKGQIQPIRGEGVKYGGSTSTDVIKRFVWSKLAPVPGSAVNLLEGENVVGEKQTTAGVVGDAFIPLAFRDIYSAMRARGIPAGTAIAILNILGMGTATYGPKTKAEEQQRAQAAEELRTAK